MRKLLFILMLGFAACSTPDSRLEIVIGTTGTDNLLIRTMPEGHNIGEKFVLYDTVRKEIIYVNMGNTNIYSTQRYKLDCK
jgi:hypothetical protein